MFCLDRYVVTTFCYYTIWRFLYQTQTTRIWIHFHFLHPTYIVRYDDSSMPNIPDNAVHISRYLRPLLFKWTHFMPTRIRTNTASNIWAEITSPSQNFNSLPVDVWERIFHLTLEWYFYLSMPGLKSFHVVPLLADRRSLSTRNTENSNSHDQWYCRLHAPNVEWLYIVFEACDFHRNIAFIHLLIKWLCNFVKYLNLLLCSPGLL